ncbi:MAG: ABC transporter permease [Planctomycetota bacterium]
MSLAPVLAARNLRRRPARTAFSILGVAFGVAIVVGVFTLDHNTVLGLSLPGLTDWKPALEVRPARSVSDPLADLRAMPGVAGVSPFFQNDVSVRAPARPGAALDPAMLEPRTVRLYALDADAIERLDALRIAEGRSLEPSGAQREVLLGQNLAEDLGVRVGDELALARPGPTARRDCVDGEFVVIDGDGAGGELAVEAPFRVVGLLARERIGRTAQGSVVVVDYRRGRELYAGVHVEPVFWIEQDPAVDIERLQASLGASFSYELNQSVLVGAAADERAFRNGVRMAGLLALVLGLYVIFHTLSMSLVERVREVATLHALGTTRGQIARIFLCEAVWIALAAAVLGVAGGLALARGLLLLGITTLGTGHHIRLFDVPWRVVLSLTGLGVGIALCGSVYPLVRARHADSVAALRGEASVRAGGVSRGFHLFAALLIAGLLPALYFAIVPVVGEAQQTLVGAILAAVGLLAALVILPLLVPAVLGVASNAIVRPLERLWPLSGRLAARAIRDSPARLAVAAASIALVTAAFVGLKGMTASLRGEIEQWAGGAIANKVYVRGLKDVELPRLREELALRGIDAELAIETASVRTYVPFLLIGLHTSEIARFGPCRDDPVVRAALERGNGVIVSERLARHFRYEIGKRLHVANAGGTVQDLEVVAVSDAYGYFPNPDERLYGIVSAEFMRKNFCLDVDTLTEIALHVEPGTDLDGIEAVVRSACPGSKLSFTRGSGVLHAHIVDIDRDFLLFDIILGLTAALAGLSVLNGQLLAALERAKELGVLKALGVTRRQSAGIVLCEALVIGVLGGLLGTALGAALTPVVVRALEALSGLDLPNVAPVSWLIACPIGAVLLSLAASVYPILRIQRMDALAAVRTG